MIKKLTLDQDPVIKAAKIFESFGFPVGCSSGSLQKAENLKNNYVGEQYFTVLTKDYDRLHPKNFWRWLFNPEFLNTYWVRATVKGRDITLDIFGGEKEWMEVDVIANALESKGYRVSIVQMSGENKVQYHFCD